MPFLLTLTVRISVPELVFENMDRLEPKKSSRNPRIGFSSPNVLDIPLPCPGVLADRILTGISCKDSQ